MKRLNLNFLIFLQIIAVIVLFQKNSFATLYTFNETYSGSQEVPPNTSSGTGTISGTYDDVTKTISVTVNFSGLTGTTTAAHFHAPAVAGTNASVVVTFTGFPTGVSTGGPYTHTFVLNTTLETQFLSGLFYANIHSGVFPGGEIRAQMNPVLVGVKLINSNVPEKFSLHQNFPNPFNPETNIRFEIPNSSFVKIIVFNSSGKEVKTIVNERLNTGSYEISFREENLSSGIYLYQLTAGEFTEVKKMLLIK